VQEFCHFYVEELGVSEKQEYEGDTFRPPYYGSPEGEAIQYTGGGNVTPIFCFNEKPDVELLRTIATDFYKKAGAYPFWLVVILSDSENDDEYAVMMTGGL